MPGQTCGMVIDLARSNGGTWVGSAILPGFDVAGVQLSDIAIQGSDVAFAIKGALGGVRIHGHLTPGGAFTGDFEQAGNQAPFTLHRTGPPQVEPPRQSAAVAKEMEGAWEGDMMFIDHNVHVRLSLANRADGHGSAKLDLKGRREVHLDVPLVTQESDLLTLEIPDQYLIYDARYGGGEISGTWQQGPYEAALVLHRVAQPR
ncbi:MAG TPA: hypothetical protein VFA04_02510 [Bryobacteraceae bacterium]|nr:hypothetical protein [Bryobacteraceae bacterium]